MEGAEPDVMLIAPPNSMSMVPSTAPSEPTGSGTVGMHPSTAFEDGSSADPDPQQDWDPRHPAPESEAVQDEGAPPRAATPPPPLEDYSKPGDGCGLAEGAIFRMRQRGQKMAPPLIGPSRRFGSTLRSGASPQTMLQFAALRVIARHTSAYCERRSHRSKWQLLRHLHHVNVSFTLARVSTGI
jgi:hypothetical protein